MNVYKHMKTHEWDPIAPYYDALFQERTCDVGFWVEMAKQFGPSILELTCGTGRLTFPMAKAGIHVTGLDISKEMLRIASRKKQALAASIQKRIAFIFGDATDFVFSDRMFTAVFLPWGFIPVTHTEQSGLLQSVRRALAKDGHIIIDIENSQEPTEDWNTIQVKDYKKVVNKGMSLLRTAYNKGSAITKIGHIIYILDIINRSGGVKRVITERTYKVYTVHELKRLLAVCGFRIVRVYGDYAFNPWNKNSSNAIVIARRTDTGIFSTIVNHLSRFIR